MIDNTKLIDIKRITKGKVDAILIMGDITKNSYIQKRLKNEKSYVLLFSDKPILYPDNYVFVIDSNLKSIASNVALSLIGDGDITLSLEEIKDFIKSDCIAFMESGNNLNEIFNNINTKLNDYDIKENIYIHLNTAKSLNLFNIEDFINDIKENIKVKNIMFTLNSNFKNADYQITIIANLKELK